MVGHAAFCHPEEACGLLAGDANGVLRMAYCLTNLDSGAASYTIDPVEHFWAMRHAEANGWELVGVFHSHPETQAYPSPTDVALALDPEWLYMIVGTDDVRAFHIRERAVSEEPLQIVTTDLDGSP